MSGSLFYRRTLWTIGVKLGLNVANFVNFRIFPRLVRLSTTIFRGLVSTTIGVFCTKREVVSVKGSVFNYIRLYTKDVRYVLCVRREVHRVFKTYLRAFRAFICVARRFFSTGKGFYSFVYGGNGSFSIFANANHFSKDVWYRRINLIYGTSGILRNYVSFVGTNLGFVMSFVGLYRLHFRFNETFFRVASVLRNVVKCTNRANSCVYGLSKGFSSFPRFFLRKVGDFTSQNVIFGSVNMEIFCFVGLTRNLSLFFCREFLFIGSGVTRGERKYRVVFCFLFVKGL